MLLSIRSLLFIITKNRVLPSYFAQATRSSQQKKRGFLPSTIWARTSALSATLHNCFQTYTFFSQGVIEISQFFSSTSANFLLQLRQAQFSIFSSSYLLVVDFHCGLRGSCKPISGFPSIFGLTNRASWGLTEIILLVVSSSLISLNLMFRLAWKSCWLSWATWRNYVREFCQITDFILSFFFQAQFYSVYWKKIGARSLLAGMYRFFQTLF